MPRPPDTVTMEQLSHSRVKNWPEKKLQNAVRRLALDLGWMFYHTWNSQRSSKGFQDCVMARGDRLIFAELKRQDKDLTEDQQEWREAIEAGPAEYYLWRPLDYLDDTIFKVLE